MQEKKDLIGTEGRNRTDTVSPPPDFESGASTSSATPALRGKSIAEWRIGSIIRPCVFDSDNNSHSVQADYVSFFGIECDVFRRPL